MKLVGRIAVVTGAGRHGGLGEAIAMRLAQDGAQVAVVDLCRERPDLPREHFGQWEELQSVARSVSQTGQRCLAFKADVTNEADVENLTREVQAAFGGIDILCNNVGGGTGAGPADSTPVIDVSLDDWNYTVGVSLTSTFLCSKHIGRVMVAQGRGGRIVNTVSVAAHHGVIGCSAYSAAKLALVSFTKTLALELAPHNILVNAFSPGVTETPYVRQRLEFVAQSRPGKSLDQLLREWTSHVPLKRPAAPSEMASVAAFLSSDDCSYMTGQTLCVDGGLTAR